MPISDIIPWKRRKLVPQAQDRGLQAKEDAFLAFQREMNQLFDRFFSGSGFDPFVIDRGNGGVFYPRVDADNVKAVLQKGVLAITLQKSAEAQSQQTVPIKTK
jgi:hypothetical protein